MVDSELASFCFVLRMECTVRWWALAGLAMFRGRKSGGAGQKRGGTPAHQTGSLITRGP